MYLTRDDYLTMRGIDLEVELRNSATDDPTNAVKIFLQNAEDWLLEYMEENFEVDTNKLDFNVMRKALAYQVDYLRLNGNLTMDREQNGLSPNAYRILKNNGYANMSTSGGKPYGFRFIK